MSRSFHTTLQSVFENKDNFPLLFENEEFNSFIKNENLNIEVKDLFSALTHSSFSHEFNVPSQEQLEFLGDAVLQLSLTDELYKRFPDKKEGHLSRLRSALVNEKVLSTMARQIGLESLILVGRGEFKKKLYLQDSVLSDSFESILGVVYLKNGFLKTKEIYLGWLHQIIPNAFDENYLDNFDVKSKLQELSLAKFKKLPKYTSEDEGTQFRITLWIDDKEVESGLFNSKKAGEKKLAENYLIKFKENICF